MGKWVFESFPVKVRLFAEVKSNRGKKEVVRIIQKFMDSNKSNKTDNKLLPLLQQESLSNKLQVVPASIMNSILVLPCKFPENCTANDVSDFVVLPREISWDTLGWPDY
jgi:hypothetical protein